MRYKICKYIIYTLILTAEYIIMITFSMYNF